MALPTLPEKPAKFGSESPYGKYFDSSHLTKDMNRRVARGGTITVSSQAVKFALRIGSMALMARMLTPADFGLIASVTVITGFIDMFRDSGLTQATIQRDKITPDQISTLFWINVTLSAGIMVIEVVLAPVLAWIYHEPRLSAVTVWLAVISGFGGLSIQHQALIQRRMEFGRLAAIEIASLIIGLAVAVAMATHGWGYWSLVGQTAGSTVSYSAFVIASSGWVPEGPQSGSGVRSMLRVGGNLAGANFFNYLTGNADSFVIALVQGPTALGTYAKAYAMFLMPIRQFLTPVTRVVIPALSRLQNDPEKFRELVIEKSYFVLFAVVLVTGFSFAAAPELVLLILGPAWGEAALIVRCLSLGGAISGTNVAGGWVNTTVGRTERQLRSAMIIGPLYTVAFVIGAYIAGPVGVACGLSVICLLLRYPLFKYLLKDSPIAPRDLLHPLVKVGVPTAIAAGIAMAASSAVGDRSVALTLSVKLAAYLSAMGGFVASGLVKLPKIDLGGR